MNGPGEQSLRLPHRGLWVAFSCSWKPNGVSVPMSKYFQVEMSFRIREGAPYESFENSEQRNHRIAERGRNLSLKQGSNGAIELH